jgi:signal transduction histidine kinase
MINALRQTWRSLSLSRQFAIVAIAVLLPGMAATGLWIAQKFSDALVRNTAEAIAISMESIVGQFAEEIETGGPLSSASRQRLDLLLLQARKNKTVVSMKVWRADGTILYSSFPEMIGRRFEPSHSLNLALQGSVGAELDSEPHTEDALEREQAVPLLEVYAPLRNSKSNEIIGVAEFYANGERLNADLRNAITESWLFVCAIAGLMAALLSGIAIKGGNTIASQQLQLRKQVDDLQSLLQSNESLREKLRLANENVSSINEMVLQHVGADLHDGPAQRLAYAIMRMSSLRRNVSKNSTASLAVEDLKVILSDTLSDIRRMCGGLSLPELNNATLVEAAERAVNSHREYTDTEVEIQIDVVTQTASLALRSCVYRLVQEGLNNAFKHAGAKQQKVTIIEKDGQIELTISDKGPGISKINQTSIKGLGLRGMQARVDALGGALTVSKGQTGGTVLKAVLPVT